VKEAENV